MALAKTVTVLLSNKTVAASASSVLSECTTLDTTAVIALSLDVSMNYNAAATAGSIVKVFVSNNDSSWNATNPYDQFTMPFTAGTVYKQQSFALNPAPKYIKVQVTNSDTAQSITGICVSSHAQSA